MVNSFRYTLYVIITLLLLSGCGGGGSGTPPPEGSSNWDEMIWDNDDWA